MASLIRFDWAMKRLLRNKANFGILEGFLSELLKEDMLIEEVLESESNRDWATNKYNRVDLLVKDSKGEYIIVEVQQNSESDYFQRMLFASSKLITQQLDEGDQYKKIRRVISINIIYFDLGQGKDYIYRGRTEFRGLHAGDILKLSKKQQELYMKTDISEVYPEYYIIKVNNFNDVAKDPLDEWIYFFKNSEVKDSFNAKGLQQAKEKLAIMNMTRDERLDFDAFIKDWRISANEIETAKMEGEEKGVEKGIEKKSFEVVKNLITEIGATDEQAAKLAGVSITFVQEVRKRCKQG